MCFFSLNHSQVSEGEQSQGGQVRPTWRSPSARGLMGRVGGPCPHSPRRHPHGPRPLEDASPDNSHHFSCAHGGLALLSSPSPSLLQLGANSGVGDAVRKGAEGGGDERAGSQTSTEAPTCGCSFSAACGLPGGHFPARGRERAWAKGPSPGSGKRSGLANSDEGLGARDELGGFCAQAVAQHGGESNRRCSPHSGC